LKLGASLFEDLKLDFIKAYSWAKPGVKYVWLPKDNRALGLLIKQLRIYYENKLDTEGMRKACQQFFNRAFVTAPDWIRTDGSLTLINSKFQIIIESPDPKSQAYITKKHHETKNAGRLYDSRLHEYLPPVKKGDPKRLGEIIKDIPNESERN
jgi:hypothetical protein